MLSNEKTMREVYANGGARNGRRSVCFLVLAGGIHDDIPSGTKLRGRAIGKSIGNFAVAFPDVRRELVSIYPRGNVVVVELATPGTHEGELALACRTLAARGKTINVPSCDAFHRESGRAVSVHCYNAASVMQQQLGVGLG